MKNTFKILGIIALVAVIGFSMAACKNGTTPPPPPGGDGDGLTITDLGNNNNKYAIAFSNDEKELHDFFAYAGLEGKTMIGGKISNDKVTLPVWKTGGTAQNPTVEKYKGNDKVTFRVLISDTEKINLGSGGSGNFAMKVENVQFKNGVGTGTAIAWED